MEEDIKILEENLKNGTIYVNCGNSIDKALENLLTRYKLYEQKLMYSLSPTTHELSLETQRNFKKIIAENINEDTYTIRRELKKYWENKDTYWKEE